MGEQEEAWFNWVKRPILYVTTFLVSLQFYITQPGKTVHNELSQGFVFPLFTPHSSLVTWIENIEKLVLVFTVYPTSMKDKQLENLPSKHRMQFMWEQH